MDIINKIYERIESLYLEKGLTRKQFENELDLPQSFLSELKSGRTKVPSAKRIQKIAEYFKVRDGYLLGDNEGKDFDEYTLGSDFKHLSDEIQRLPSEVKTITVNLIDSFYLLVRNEIRDQNIELIETYYNIIRGLFLIKVSQSHLRSSIEYPFLDDIVNSHEETTKTEKDLIKNINRLLINPINDAYLKEIDDRHQEILLLWNKLDSTKQAEFKGELKGYIRAKSESSEASAKPKEADNPDKLIPVFRAARSKDGKKPEIVEMPKSKIDRLKTLPRVTREEDF